MPERNFDNRTLFWGDNIDFMRAMNSQTVDLIATDPPFNKGRDFHATPDSLAAGAREFEGQALHSTPLPHLPCPQRSIGSARLTIRVYSSGTGKGRTQVGVRCGAIGY